uniref:Acid ceramidase N-terminal domain-containing protein n=1 Tax=Knipowitschia caucasica TaxID=637954 RepID=A0AAV2LGL1_KNICA
MTNSLLGWGSLLLTHCGSGFGVSAPPTLNISLDQEPEERWKPLSLYFDPAYLKNASDEVIEKVLSGCQLLQD